jgi:tetratricopeptide (TPR) repeat protein
MRPKAQALVLAGLLILGSGATSASAQNGSVHHEDTLAFITEFPMVLVYRGLALYDAEDFDGAINAWQRYLDLAGKGADSAGVTALIREAWIREYPMSLLYEGYALYAAKDIPGAVASWTRYIELAPEGEDTTAIRQMIVQARVPEEDVAKAELKRKPWYLKQKTR